MAYELAVAGKKLVAARRAVEAWRKLVDPASPEVQAAWKDVVAGLRQAEELAARARKLERVDPPAARGFYRKSLEIAADLPEALAGLSRCPPDAPTGPRGPGARRPDPALLDAAPRRMAWGRSPSPSSGSAAACRSTPATGPGSPRSPPASSRIAASSRARRSATRCLAKRGEAESLAAVAAGPVLFLPDVQDVRVEPRDGEVELSWIPPHGVFEVRVVRKRGARRPDPRDGDRVGASLDQASIRDLSDDQVYHYGIYAIYRTPDGQRFPSPGVVVAAIPRSPLAPLDAPRLTLTPGGQVRLDWIEPSRGSVRILRTIRPLAHARGQPSSRRQAEELGGRLARRPWTPDRAQDADPPPSATATTLRSWRWEEL